MSRTVTIPYTHTSDVVSFDSTNSTYYAILTGYPADNGLGDGTGTYAGFNLTRGSNAVSNIYYNFDCSTIPDDATITSVSCYYRASVSTTNTNYINTSNLQLCAGTTAKGTATSKLTATATYYTINGGSNWTVAEIKNCKIRGYAKRGTRNTSSQYAIRLFGGTLTVEYTVQGTIYSITATSNVDGETISPSTQEVQEGESGSIKIVTNSLTNKTLLDNNTNVTSSLVYVPPDTGGTITRYPADVETGGSGTISGLRYLTTIGHGVENPSGTTSTDYTSTGGTTALIYYKFDFNDLPDSATIDNMTVQVRYKVGNTSYAQSVNTYNGTTAKGTAVTLTSTSETTTTISSPGTWTAAQLKDDPSVGLTLSYSGAIITGITWSVTYTANEPSYYRYTLSNVQTDHIIIYNGFNAVKIFYTKQNGSWVRVFKIFHKENGSWVEKDLDYLSDSDIHYVKNNGEITNARLPAEYQEVEYIGITNVGPYINTGIDPGNLEVVSTFQLTVTPSSTTFGLGAAGSCNVLSAKEFDPIFLITKDGTSFEWKDSDRNSVITKSVDLQKHDIIYNNSNHQIIFDNQVIVTNSNLPCTDLSNTNMYIFGTNFTITSTWVSNWRLYYCKITNNDNNTVLREFIPCYRKSDNAIGMYDIANYKFYANAGSDSFIKGADV